MTRPEFVESCKSLTEEQLHKIVLDLREKAGSRIPPEVAAQFRSLDDVTSAEEIHVETAWGKSHVYIVRKKDHPENKLPIFFNVHGGGWCLDHTERDIYFSRRIAVATDCLVVDVDYVLAPEYPYPAAIEEIEALLNKLPELADTYGGDVGKVILCGQSAGGNLLGAVTQRKKVTAQLNILAQILCYFPGDNYNNRFADQKLDDRGKTTEYYGFFYNRDFEERKNHDVSISLSAPDELKGVPVTDVITAGLDNLMPEAKMYYDLLTEAGIRTSYRCFENSRHGFLVNLYDEWKDGEDYVAELVRGHLSKG